MGSNSSTGGDCGCGVPVEDHDVETTDGRSGGFGRRRACIDEPIDRR
jgi:hypothetical protein